MVRDVNGRDREGLVHFEHHLALLHLHTFKIWLIKSMQRSNEDQRRAIQSAPGADQAR